MLRPSLSGSLYMQVILQGQLSMHEKEPDYFPLQASVWFTWICIEEKQDGCFVVTPCGLDPNYH